MPSTNTALDPKLTEALRGALRLNSLLFHPKPILLPFTPSAEEWFDLRSICQEYNSTVELLTPCEAIRGDHSVYDLLTVMPIDENTFEKADRLWETYGPVVGFNLVAELTHGSVWTHPDRVLRIVFNSTPYFSEVTAGQYREVLELCLPENSERHEYWSKTEPEKIAGTPGEELAWLASWYKSRLAEVGYSTEPAHQLAKSIPYRTTTAGLGFGW